MEEMRIEIGEEEDDSDDDDDDDLFDDHDRQMIDRAMHEAGMPSTSSNTDICTNPQRDLTERLQQYDANFLDSVLPLP